MTKVMELFQRSEAPLPAEADLPIRLTRKAPAEAAKLLQRYPDDVAARALALVNPALTVDILALLPQERRQRIAAADLSGRSEQWITDRKYPQGTVGRQMDKPLAVFAPETTVRAATERLRELVTKARLHLAFVTESDGRLLGVFAFRALLFAAPDAPVSSLMSPELATLRPEMSLLEATKAIVARHYPAYPVVDAAGKLIGMIRARTIFEQEAFEISAQAGKMVGVEAEERISTPWPRSFRFRHPWLQLNLLTAFIAAGVVSVFQVPGQATGTHGSQRVLEYAAALQQRRQLVHLPARGAESITPTRGQHQHAGQKRIRRGWRHGKDSIAMRSHSKGWDTGAAQSCHEPALHSPVSPPRRPAQKLRARRAERRRLARRPFAAVQPVAERSHQRTVARTQRHDAGHRGQ